MKKFIVLIVLLCASVVIAASPEAQRDGVGYKMPIFSPDGRKDVSLTVNSSTVDMRNDIQWSAFAPGDCSFRVMSTSTKVGLKRTIKGGSWTFPRGRNSSTPFINFTSCTSGELQRQ